MSLWIGPPARSRLGELLWTVPQRDKVWNPGKLFLLVHCKYFASLPHSPMQLTECAFPYSIHIPLLAFAVEFSVRISPFIGISKKHSPLRCFLTSRRSREAVFSCLICVIFTRLWRKTSVWRLGCEISGNVSVKGFVLEPQVCWLRLARVIVATPQVQWLSPLFHVNHLHHAICLGMLARNSRTTVWWLPE